MNLFLSMTYLFNPLSQIVEALFRKGSEGATNCDIIWYNIECTTSLELCNCHNLWKHTLCKEAMGDCCLFSKQAFQVFHSMQMKQVKVFH